MTSAGNQSNGAVYGSLLYQSQGFDNEIIMDIIRSQIAIWRPKLYDKLTVSTMPAGVVYREPGSQAYVKSTVEMYRYAKNYTTGKGKNAIKFCLFVRDFVDDSKNVEKQLDAVAKGVTVEQAREINSRADYNDFDYLNEFLKEGK